MRDQPLAPSQIIFPVALDSSAHDTVHEDARSPHVSWGWLEFFVMVQVLWGVLLFVPGSQAYRIYIRGFPYVASLIALIACLRTTGIESRAPGARWILASLAIMVASLAHPATWLVSGIAQVVFQVAIAA